MLVIMTRVLLVIDGQESFRQGAAVAGHLQSRHRQRRGPPRRRRAGNGDLVCGCCTPRGVLPKSHISPGNLNRRLRIEAMYFL